MKKITGSKQENRKWAEKIWGTYSSQIYNLCRKKCQDDTDADDLFQTVALKFLQNAGQIESKASVFPWLFQVMQNCFYDEMKRRKRVVPFSAVMESEEDYITLPQEKSIFCSMESSYDEFVAKYLSKLTLLEKALIELTFVGGLNIAEIAPIFGVSANALIKRRHSAIEKLRKRFIQ